MLHSERNYQKPNHRRKLHSLSLHSFHVPECQVAIGEADGQLVRPAQVAESGHGRSRRASQLEAQVAPAFYRTFSDVRHFSWDASDNFKVLKKKVR